MLESYFAEFFQGAFKTIAFFSGVGGVFYMSNQLFKKSKVTFIKDLHQTVEDRSTSTHIMGLAGSGKTYFALYLFLKDLEKGYGSLWLSTQGIENFLYQGNRCSLLDFIPLKRIKDTILLRPYDDFPNGINLLRTYTNTQLEREQIADSVITLFRRLFKDISVNMEGILVGSTLALLEYADAYKISVCLWDLYTFLSDDVFRKEIISSVNNVAVLDMLKELEEEGANKSAKNSLNAILRRFRKMLYSDFMVAFLSQREGDVDLLKAVKTKKIIICDFFAGGIGERGIGKENSRFLSELVVSKFQLIAETRNVNSPLFPLYLDEFQTYTTTSENIKEFISLNRQRRMPIALINQYRGQLDKSLLEAVDSVGTRYIFLTLNSKDKKYYSDIFPQYISEFEKATKRRYVGDVRVNGKNYDFVKNTPDIEPFYVGLGYIIKQRNKGKKSIDELIKTVKTKQKQNKIFDYNEDDFQ